MCCVDPMHSINIDNLELRWRWIYGDGHLGFKRLVIISNALLAAKLFCVPGEAMEMDGKRFTLAKGLSSVQLKGNASVSKATFVVRHSMTLGEMAELPVVKALFEVLTTTSGRRRILQAFDRVRVAAVLVEHAAVVQHQLMDDDDDDDDDGLVARQLDPEPSVVYFNTVVKAGQGKRYSNQQSLLAALLGLVGHEVQDTDGKRYILTASRKLRSNTMLVSVGDGTMTAGQLLATPHLAALFHLGVQCISANNIMTPVDPTDFAAVKQIFTAIAAECTTASFLCHDSC